MAAENNRAAFHGALAASTVSNILPRMLWKGYPEGARLRCIASGVGSEDFDEVVA